MKIMKIMNLQRKYIHKFNEVDSYFIQMRENQLYEIETENDIMFVKGEENYLILIDFTYSRKVFQYFIFIAVLF